MNPITFEGVSLDLQRPPGMTEEECRPLPVRRENQPPPRFMAVAVHDANGVCFSCWQMSFKERIKALFTGKIWLGVWFGKTQPPVLVTVDQPFELPKPIRREPLEQPGRAGGPL